MLLWASRAWLTVLQEQVSPRSPSSGSNQYRQLGFGVANRLTDSQSNLIGERFAEPSLCSSRSLLKPFVTLSLDRRLYLPYGCDCLGQPRLFLTDEPSDIWVWVCSQIIEKPKV